MEKCKNVEKLLTRNKLLILHLPLFLKYALQVFNFPTHIDFTYTIEIQLLM